MAVSLLTYTKKPGNQNFPSMRVSSKDNIDYTLPSAGFNT